MLITKIHVYYIHTYMSMSKKKYIKKVEVENNHFVTYLFKIYPPVLTLLELNQKLFKASVTLYIIKGWGNES